MVQGLLYILLIIGCIWIILGEVTGKGYISNVITGLIK